MKDLAALFWQVLRFKAGPEDVPYSKDLLRFVACVAAIIGLLTQTFISKDTSNWQPIVGLVVIGMGIETIAIGLALHFKKLSERFVQSLTALFGADVLLSLVAMCLLPIYAFAPEKSPLLGLGFLIEMFIVCWSLAVRGFVYHRALNIGAFQANIMSLALFFITVFTALTVFPELAQQPA